MSHDDFKKVLRKDNLESTTIHTDKGWTERAKQIFKDIGIPFDEAINVYLHQVCRVNGFPMDLVAPSDDVVNSIKSLKKHLYAKKIRQDVKDATRPIRSYIKHYRIAHHLSIQELADKAHLNVSTVTRAENGQNVNISVYYRLAYIMGRNLEISIGNTSVRTHFHFPKRIPTPKMSEIIKDEFMKPLHMSDNTLAQKLHLPYVYVKLVLEDRAPVNEPFDLSFSHFFGTSRGLLLRIQKDIQKRNQSLHNN